MFSACITPGRGKKVFLKTPSQIVNENEKVYNQEQGMHNIVFNWQSFIPQNFQRRSWAARQVN